MPDLPRKIDEQIKHVREFLNVATLSVFKNRDMAVSFKSASDKIKESNTIKANMMVQIAINKALTIDAPKYNKSKFEKAIIYALSLTKNHKDFYPAHSTLFRPTSHTKKYLHCYKTAAPHNL